MTRDSNDASPAPRPPAPLHLSYATASPQGRSAPHERQFWITSGALLVLGVALFIGGLAALLAAGSDHGGYVLLLGAAAVAVIVTLRRQARDR